ncbi:hypothetical protein CEXT_155511 [Caerostris extrusa]|uniref:Uncharacterized protein n=1 Tax=Caerostris extrusa TaxID=172846 RepID=A0AAV4XA59_CAEEX|nr:hypothetical protein CEXT_155511 [Caerostris extrusa]
MIERYYEDTNIIMITKPKKPYRLCRTESRNAHHIVIPQLQYLLDKQRIWEDLKHLCKHYPGTLFALKTPRLLSDDPLYIDSRSIKTRHISSSNTERCDCIKQARDAEDYRKNANHIVIPQLQYLLDKQRIWEDLKHLCKHYPGTLFALKTPRLLSDDPLYIDSRSIKTRHISSSNTERCDCIKQARDAEDYRK